MEALRSDSVHTTESIHSLSCINTHHIDELSKEKEDELLYGGDDGDEEDALSDDSMRLRLSDDDEAEPDDILTSVLDNKEDKPKNKTIEVTCENSIDVQASPVPEKNEMKNNTTPSREKKEEEHCSGNVSMGDKLLTHHAKDTKRNINGLMRPQMINVMPRYPWPNYKFQWRFASTPRARFPYIDHFRYIRHRYLTPRGQFRNPYDYNTRFHNAFVPFEKGRDNGMFNSYNKLMYYREQTRAYKPSPMKRFNTKSDVDQTVMSPSDANISSRTEADTSIKDESCIDKNIETCSELVIKSSISSKQINDDSSKLPNEILKNVKTEDLNKETLSDTVCVSNSLVSEHETKIVQGNTMIQSSDVECKNNKSINTDTSNESSNKEITNSLINSQDDNKESMKEKGNTETGNSHSDCNDLQNFDNFNILEKLLTKGPKNLSGDEDVKFIEGNNENNKTKDVTVKTTATLDLSEKKGAEQIHQPENHELDANVKITKSMKNDSIEGNTVNNELVIKEKVDSVIDKSEEILKDENDVSMQGVQSNEDIETHVSKPNNIMLNDLNNRESDKNTDITQNNIFESLVNGDKCDKDRLNDSDNSTNSSKLLQLLVSDDHAIKSKLDLQKQNSVTEENIKSVYKGNSIVNSTSKTSLQTENTSSTLDENNLSSVKSQNSSLGSITNVIDGDNSEKSVLQVPVTTQRRRRRTKKMIAAAQEAVSEEDKQVRESGRQKRKTAKNAEEIIRKKFLNHDSDLESSDSSEKFVIVNHKVNQDARSLSPPSLKRNCSDLDNITMNGSVKKIKVNCDSLSDESASKENIKKLDYVHKFFQRDLKEKLPKLTQEELEELLIQKIVETITMRGEIGKLREQARISERNQEVTRAKCQQLAKQIKDFEMVLSRNAADRRANNDKPIPPIKINRSVGLQVNFITDHGIQNLRQMQQNSNLKSVNVSNNGNALNTSGNEMNSLTSPRKGVKVRSPRRSEPVTGPAAVISQNSTQPPNIMPTITPAALVVTKPVEVQHTLQLPNQSNVQQMISNSQLPPQQQQPQQTIVLNGKFSNQLNRQNTTVNVSKPRTNDLIDLTDEEEKSKGATSLPVVTTTITDQQISLAQKTQPCFQRVIQTIPGNVAITNQPPSIRVVQPASQPTPTALVNNMNAPRLAYVMQSGVGTTRQLLIAPNTTTIRPVTSCNRTSFSTLTYKTVSTVANGTVRVLTTSAPSNIQLHKHPAPLPDTRNYVGNAVWKLPPPAPSLKISKVANGIVLSWNMNLSDKYADIASYQLYAYQEVAGIPPNTSLWKKVGDVRALPLPMACTLTQFSEGNNYYFAVRAVDTHSRKGQYSIPGNISL
ncbi:fibronectin-III type domain-containing protein windei isoform X2 [Nomia melanderi]|uniref:fibronectin-III type domain-containing protein windei isoform X2 n=1 Tax=Nomia melanderi TaxID=2448451 RepID=UPI001304538B|nr:activating transcription factor 7-interacting protein 1 isoform X2 [Nomia melanderi]